MTHAEDLSEMQQAQSAAQHRLPARAPERPPEEIPSAVCAYWGEEACGRTSTFVIYGPRAPIASCDMHVGQQVGWQVYLSRREAVPLEEITVCARRDPTTGLPVRATEQGRP